MFEYTAKVAKTLRQDGPLALRKRDSNSLLRGNSKKMVPNDTLLYP